jgi:hypothetical protein
MAEKNDPSEWTPARLEQAVRAGTTEEKVAVLKRIGLLTANGKPKKSAQAWGNKPSRTPVLSDEK